MAERYAIYVLFCWLMLYKSTCICSYHNGVLCMKFNIGKKILGTVLVMALLVIAAACVGMFMTVRISRRVDPLMQEKIPLKTISMEALLVAEKSLSACRKLFACQK